jgi:hypothetical protein
MIYEVLEDFYIQEFNVQLLVGDRLSDGDLEPDVIAQLLSVGVLVPVED